MAKIATQQLESWSTDAAYAAVATQQLESWSTDAAYAAVATQQLESWSTDVPIGRVAALWLEIAYVPQLPVSGGGDLQGVRTQGSETQPSRQQGAHALR